METQEIAFAPNPKMPRFYRECVVTEKIDGTSGCVIVQPDGRVLAGSRNRLLTLEQDNFGFCAWVKAHEDELRGLGVGLHRGEWWGSGIQRNYGLLSGERRFSLFNTGRWNEALWDKGEAARAATVNQPPARPFAAPPACCHVVPVLWNGIIRTSIVNFVLERLVVTGSQAQPGFDSPEGVVIFHVAGGHNYKVTISHDNERKTQCLLT